jgi:hypothetical protein
MNNKYTGEDVKARLSGTILRYRGVPVLCEVSTDNILTLFSLEGGGGIVAQVQPDDRDVDISSLTLGFVNIDHPDYRLAVYLKREPLRQYRQGVELARLTQTVLRNGMTNVHHKILQSKGIVECVLDRYPSFEHAVLLITKKNFHSVALSKNVAIKRDGELLKVYVKTDEVGYIRLGEKKLIVPKTENSFYSMYFLSEITGWVITEGNK